MLENKRTVIERKKDQGNQGWGGLFKITRLGQRI